MNTVTTLPTENNEIITGHNAAKDFEDKLVILVNQAYDAGVYGTVLVGILNTTAFQVMQSVMNETAIHN